MAGLPVGLSIAIWLVASLWVVGEVAYYLDYHTDFILIVFLLGTGAAIAEWSAIRNNSEQ